MKGVCEYKLSFADDLKRGCFLDPKEDVLPESRSGKFEPGLEMNEVLGGANTELTLLLFCINLKL